MIKAFNILIFAIIIIYNFNAYSYVSDYIANIEEYEVLSNQKYITTLWTDNMEQKLDVAKEVDKIDGLSVTNAEVVDSILILDLQTYNQFFTNKLDVEVKQTDFGLARKFDQSIPVIVQAGSDFDNGEGSTFESTSYVSPSNCSNGVSSQVTNFGNETVTNKVEESSKQCKAAYNQVDTGTRTFMQVGTFDESTIQLISSLFGQEVDFIMPFSLVDDEDLNEHNVELAQSGKPVLIDDTQTINIIVDGSAISTTELASVSEKLNEEYPDAGISFESNLDLIKNEASFKFKIHIQNIIISFLTSLSLFIVYFAFLNFNVKSEIQELLIISLLGGSIKKKISIEIVSQICMVLLIACIALLIFGSNVLNYLLFITGVLLLLIIVSNLIIYYKYKNQFDLKNLKGADEYA